MRRSAAASIFAISPSWKAGGATGALCFTGFAAGAVGLVCCIVGLLNSHPPRLAMGARTHAVGDFVVGEFVLGCVPRQGLAELVSDEGGVTGNVRVRGRGCGGG